MIDKTAISNINRKLFVAIRLRNIVLLGEAIKKGASLTSKEDDRTPLCYAADQEWWEGIYVILTLYKKDLDSEMGYHEVLPAAIRKNKLAVTRLLFEKISFFEKIPSPFYSNKNREAWGSCLFYAIDNDNPEMIALLLKHHADSRVKNSDNKTAIGYAAMCQKWNCVVILAKNDPSYLENALFYAVYYDNLNVAQILLKQGASANMNMADYKDKNLLHFAIDNNN